MEHAGEVWLVDMRQACPMLLARAVFAVAFGLVALISPPITLLILAWPFGIFGERRRPSPVAARRRLAGRTQVPSGADV